MHWAVLGLSANEPSALLVVLVVLRSGRHRGAAFVAGWITALIVVTAGAGFVARLGFGPRRGGPRRVTLVIELIIGVVLLGWSTWYWLRNPGRAPAIVAGTTLLRSNASTTVRFGGLVTFVIIGTLMVAAPVVATYVSPVWAGARLDAVFDWTLRRRRILLTTILISVGLFISVRALLHLTHTR